MSSEFSQPSTGPPDRRKPLLIASEGPLSRSETQKSRPSYRFRIDMVSSALPPSMTAYSSPWTSWDRTLWMVLSMYLPWLYDGVIMLIRVQFRMGITNLELFIVQQSWNTKAPRRSCHPDPFQPLPSLQQYRPSHILPPSSTPSWPWPDLPC